MANFNVIVDQTTNNVTVVGDGTEVIVTSIGTQGPAGTTDHGSLTGLSDDDHAQYLTTGRADTWLATKTTSNLTEGSNLYFTDERAQDAVGSALTDTSTVDFTYNDGSNTISASVIQSGIDHGSISGLSDDDHTQYHNDSRANTWLATKSTSDLSEGSNLYYTDERVDDRVNALLQAGTNVSLVYNDLANTLTINATGGGSSSDSFVTIQTDSGTNPVADSSTDTLTLTTDDTLAYSFVGDSSTDTVELNISDASTSVRGLVSTSNQTFKGIKTISNNSIDEPAFDEGFVNELFVQNTSNQSAIIRAGSSSVINSNNFDLDVLAGFGSYAEQNGTGTIGIAFANVSESILTDNGNITTSIGSFSSVSNESSSGSINVASSFVSKINNISTGTIVNGYALFADQNDATNKWGLYIDIGTSENYLSGGLEIDQRLQLAQGSDVAAANDLTLGAGNAFKITGNTTINAITSTGWKDGSSIVLRFTGTPTVKHNTAGGAGTAVIKLAGSSDFSASNDSILRLTFINGEWHEESRKVA